MRTESIKKRNTVYVCGRHWNDIMFLKATSEQEESLIDVDMSTIPEKEAISVEATSEQEESLVDVDMSTIPEKEVMSVEATSEQEKNLIEDVEMPSEANVDISTNQENLIEDVEMSSEANHENVEEIPPEQGNDYSNKRKCKSLKIGIQHDYLR